MTARRFDFVEEFPIATIIRPWGATMEQKAEMPTLAEVVAYATPQLRKFIGKLASDLPHEQRDEIEQEGYLRILKAYDRIDPEKGWKSFVYRHCEGTVKDYLRFGKGFAEKKWSLNGEEPSEEEEDAEEAEVSEPVYQSAPAHRDRVSLEFNGTAVDLDQVVGAAGVFSEIDSDRLTIRWDLVARMASQDEIIHAFAKSLLGYGIEEMAPVFGLCRARVGQLIQAFIARFDDPELVDCPWFKQTCFAFGLCGHLGMPDVDQSDEMGFSVGWHLEPVDLDDLTPCLQIREDLAQMNFFAEMFDA